MTDLERRALMGDKEAQRECTEKGIMLPCPFCGGIPGKHKIKEDFFETGTYITGYAVFCQNCRSSTEYKLAPIDALALWNTRPAPPVGRCDE